MKNKKRKVYSEKKRQEAFKLHKKGKSLREIAKKIGCHRNTVYRWVAQLNFKPNNWQGENPKFIKDEWPDHTLNRAPFIEGGMKLSDAPIMKDVKSRAKKSGNLEKLKNKELETLGYIVSKVPNNMTDREKSIVNYEAKEGKPVDLEEHTELHKEADESKKPEKHDDIMNGYNRLLRKASKFIKENLKLKKEDKTLKTIVAENILEKRMEKDVPE